jgi:hypothetical protein
MPAVQFETSTWTHDASRGHMGAARGLGDPGEWIGTQVRFELEQEDGFTIVLFRHQGWREPVEFMYHCSTKRALYLMSLEKRVETGKGEPAPHYVDNGAPRP